MKFRNSILIPGLVYLTVLLSLLTAIVLLRNGNPTVILVLDLLAIVFILGGAFYFVFGIFYPVNQMKNRVDTLSRSGLPQTRRYASFHEFKEMEDALDEHLKRLRQVINTAENLAKGEIDDTFESRGDQDELGAAVVKLRESILVSNIAARKRRKLDELQNWASVGIARFGQLLRDSEGNADDLSAVFIQQLVHYLDMEVGGLYLRGHDEEGQAIYRMAGAYAFDRKKRADHTFKPGEGLVGRCALERETILITEIPEDYITIRSGLGEDKPATILLVPVILYENVLAVFELATFSIVKQYKVSFLETLAESIAPSVSRLLNS